MPDALTREAEEYLRRLGACLSALDRDERREIIAEVRAHFAERLAQGKTEVVAGFDPPEIYAASFIEESLLSSAVAGGSSIALGRALLAGLQTGAKTLFVVFPLLGVQFIAFIYLVCGVLKPFFFRYIGTFVGDGQFSMGASWWPGTRTDVLGWWTVPVYIVPSAITLWACRRVMAALARTRLERVRRAKVAK